MRLTVALFGCFVVAIGLVGAVSPPRLLTLVGRLVSKQGLFFIAGLRLCLGIALWLSADSSRAPHFLQIVGAIAIVSGLVTPFVGVRRFDAIMGWWAGRAPDLVRVWCVGLLLFGMSLVWAVFPSGGA